MKYPKRTSNHILESNSWKIYLSKTPPEWIIREVTERDYGIDSYIEIVEEDGKITGNLCSIQLKTKESIKWNKDIALLSGIKKSTVNYWMGLPVPVFIFWADSGQGKLYFCSVEDQVRKNFSKFLDEKSNTFSFEFFKYFEIGTELGNTIFKAFFHKQRNYPVFLNNLQDLIIHFEEYNMHILGNLGRDYFLFVDEREFFLTLHVYSICLKLSNYFGIKWTATSPSNLLEYDKKIWPNEYCSTIHELTHDKLLRELYPTFCEIVKQSVELITEQQEEYWINSEYLLFQICNQIKLKLIGDWCYIKSLTY